MCKDYLSQLLTNWFGNRSWGWGPRCWHFLTSVVYFYKINLDVCGIKLRSIINTNISLSTLYCIVLYLSVATPLKVVQWVPALEGRFSLLLPFVFVYLSVSVMCFICNGVCVLVCKFCDVLCDYFSNLVQSFSQLFRLVFLDQMLMGWESSSLGDPWCWGTNYRMA